MGMLKLVILTVFLTLAFAALASAQMGPMFGGGGLFPLLLMLTRSGMDMKQIMPFFWMMMMNGGGGAGGGFGAM